MKAQDGRRIETAADWWLRRRREIFQLLQQDLYGAAIDPRIPVTWVVSAATTGSQVVGTSTYPYRQKTLTGTVDISSYPQLRNAPLITAQCRYPTPTGRKYPVVVTFSEGVDRFQYTAPYGIGTCSYNPTALQPDSGGANLSSYLIGLVTRGNWRKPQARGRRV